MNVRAAALLFPLLLAADWPQWRGPDRTGLSAETGLLKTWPADGPKLLWTANGLGGGYSTPSVVGGKIFVMGAKGLVATGGGKGGKDKGGKDNSKDKGKAGGKGGGAAESVLCLDAANGGKVLWSREVGTTGNSYPGPRSTPTVDGDRVYAISSNGNLVCLAAADGKLLWKKSFRDDFGGAFGNWNYAESPLIDGDHLVCTPGGTSATIVCLDKKDGKVIWKGQTSGLKDGKHPATTAGYSSALVATIAGKKTYVQMIQGGVVGLDAATGKQLWHYDEPASSGANISTPIVQGDAVFAATSYGNGGGRADVVKKGDGLEAKEKYFVKSLQNHHGGMVLVDGYVYGTNNASLMCVNFETGKVEWTARSVGKGSVAYADGLIFHRGEGGEMAIVEANSKQYKEKGRFKQPSRSSAMAWPHPVVSGGRLYLRDWDALLCFDVKGE